MNYFTTETVAGREISQSLGAVMGSVVQSKHLGRDIMARLKTLVGGEIRGYTEMLVDARNKALGRMLDEARAKGADAVVGVRFATSAVMEGAAEIMVFGTAVNLR